MPGGGTSIADGFGSHWRYHITYALSDCLRLVFLGFYFTLGRHRSGNRLQCTTGNPVSAWKEFEILNAKIQADVAPNATVESNKRILGKSGRQRQIDVAITEKIGLFPVLIVLECKNYRRPVGIAGVEAFATKIDDVGAQHGVMVSAKGFDAGARAVADQHSITLLTHRDATEADWNRVVGRQFWMRLIMSVCVRWSASAVVGGSPTAVFEANQVLWLADGTEISISNAVRPVLEMTRAARPVGEFVAWAVPLNPLFLDAGRTIAVERLRSEEKTSPGA